MSLYQWEGRSTNGQKVKGEMEAQTAQQVFNALRAQRITPNLKKIREKGTGLNKELSVPGFRAKVKTKDVVVFTRQFATMIDAGLPIVQGIDVLAKQHENPAMRKTLSNARDVVQSGGTLSDALSRHPEVFDHLFVNMVAAGETGGVLDIILERLAVYLEKMARLKRQVMTALIYPAVVCSVAVIVTAILLIFVIPTFADLFSDFGAALPAPTRVVINLSTFTTDNIYVISLTTFLFVWLLRRFVKTDRGKNVTHPLALKVPVVGEIIRKVSVARFARTLSTMLSSGVPILEALSICAKTAGNKVVEREVLKARISISEGKPLATPLANSVIFPPMVVQMIAVGESTGALDAMLGKVADFYEDEVDNSVNAMKQLIEPLMIVVIGGIIGALVIAMYLPIFQLGTVIN
jgi:type IV pilus assembly protein PilC